MKRSTAELLDKALTRSQLLNTDFVSWSDKLYILNSVYQRLYSRIAEAPNPFYQKSATLLIIPAEYSLIHKPHALLPSDCIDVRAVFNENRTYRIDSQSYHSDGSQLVFDTPTVQGPVSIDYLPSVRLITVPNDTLNTNGPASCDGHHLLNNTDLIDLVSGDITERPVYYSPTDGTPIVNSGIAWQFINNQLIRDSDLFTINNVQSFLVDRRSDYQINYIDTTNDPHAIDFNDNIIDDTIHGWFCGQGWYVPQTVNNTPRIYFTPDADTTPTDVTDTFVNDSTEILHDFRVCDPYLCWTKTDINTNRSQTFCGSMADLTSTWEIDPARTSRTYLPRTSILDFSYNDSTGYGLIMQTPGQTILCSVCPDTFLDFPKDCCFDWLEANLAVELARAAQRDVSNLTSWLDTAEEYLVESLSVGEYPRVRRTGRYW